MAADRKEDPWWYPEQLRASEARFRARDLDKVDRNSDFGAYRVIRETGSLEGSNIFAHNDLNPLPKLLMLDRFFFRGTTIRSYADVGCGIGRAVAEARRVWPRARICGIDVSRDAIEYARSTVPGVDFVCMVIDEGTKLPGVFDVITAFEFYPFTRTDDLEFQLGILKTLAAALSVEGRLLIWHPPGNPNSVDVNIDAMRRACPELSFTVHIVPHPSLFWWVRHRRLASLFTSGASVLLGRTMTRQCLVVSRTWAP